MPGKHGPMYRPTNRTRLGADFTWKGGKKVAVIINVPFEGWSENAHSGIGPMGNVLKAGSLDTNAVSWGMYGAVRGIDRLLRIMGERKVKGSLMVNGVVAELYPELVRRAHEEGHCLFSHAYAMDTIPIYLSPDDEAKNIARTGELIRSVTGVQPRGWISPRGTPSTITSELLVKAGYDWHGDAMDDDLPYLETVDGKSLVAIPLNMEVNDMPLSVRYGNPPSQMLDLFDTTLKWQLEREPGAGMIDVTAHTHVYGRPSGAWVFDEIIARAKSYADVWVCTRDEIADHVRGFLKSRSA